MTRPRSPARPAHQKPHSQHNRLHGQLCCARVFVRNALAAPTITPEAEQALVAAMTALDAACAETYRRRRNPDGSIWERPE